MGCPMAEFCAPRKGGNMGYDGHECPGYCPTKCGPDEIPCSGGRDMNNCDLPEICVPMKGGPMATIGKDGMECPAICPTNCGPHELRCWGGRDWNGCEMPGSCKPIFSGQWDHYGNQCPETCDVQCADDEMRCSGGEYPNGCRVPDICIAQQYTKGANDMECQTHCPITCAQDDMVCPGGVDFSSGCQHPDTCTPRKGYGMGKDGSECPGFCQVDPHMCGPETTFCDGGFDQNDCQMPNMCVPFANMKGNDGMDCPENCPANCGSNGQSCMGEMDENGCLRPEFCVPQDHFDK